LENAQLSQAWQMRYGRTRRGRASNSPPQLGHFRCSTSSVQVAQKVHSKEQIRASLVSGSKSLPQRSQLDRISSIDTSTGHIGDTSSEHIGDTLLDGPMRFEA
jgi:hypothetical protein